jgi:hypothetical protein
MPALYPAAQQLLRRAKLQSTLDDVQSNAATPAAHAGALQTGKHPEALLPTRWQHLTCQRKQADEHVQRLLQGAACHEERRRLHAITAFTTDPTSHVPPGSFPDTIDHKEPSSTLLHQENDPSPHLRSLPSVRRSANETLKHAHNNNPLASCGLAHDRASSQAKALPLVCDCSPQHCNPLQQQNWPERQQQQHQRWESLGKVMQAMAQARDCSADYAAVRSQLEAARHGSAAWDSAATSRASSSDASSLIMTPFPFDFSTVADHDPRLPVPKQPGASAEARHLAEEATQEIVSAAGPQQQAAAVPSQLVAENADLVHETLLAALACPSSAHAQEEGCTDALQLQRGPLTASVLLEHTRVAQFAENTRGGACSIGHVNCHADAWSAATGVMDVLECPQHGTQPHGPKSKVLTIANLDLGCKQQTTRKKHQPACPVTPGAGLKALPCAQQSSRIAVVTPLPQSHSHLDARSDQNARAATLQALSPLDTPFFAKARSQVAFENHSTIQPPLAANGQSGPSKRTCSSQNVLVHNGATALLHARSLSRAPQNSESSQSGVGLEEQPLARAPQVHEQGGGRTCDAGPFCTAAHQNTNTAFQMQSRSALPLKVCGYHICSFCLIGRSEHAWRAT